MCNIAVSLTMCTSAVSLLQITGLFLSRDVVTITPLLLNPQFVHNIHVRVETVWLLRYQVL